MFQAQVKAGVIQLQLLRSEDHCICWIRLGKDRQKTIGFIACIHGSLAGLVARR